ncbi:MAG TPA: ATP-binding protein [Anaerolineales bacterium]|nr:ATP-binding protein [Anaerolineales bacterium]
MTLSGIGELPLFKRRSPGAEEIEALLDLLPQPTIVADSRNGRVLFANAKATQLTAYTRREFSELELSTLLPGFEDNPLENSVGSPNTQTLVTRGSQSIQIKVKNQMLGGPDHWVAISLVPSAQEEENTSAISQQRWEAMHLLSLAAQQEDLASTYRQVLQAGNLLTGASNLALYLPIGSGENLKLQAVTGSGIHFPIELLAIDTGHLRTPKIWQPGKPIESLLHKLANTSKLSYMATTPLDMTDPGFGLLAAADSEKHPPKELPTLLQILATAAASIKMKAELANKLRSDLEKFIGSEKILGALHENVQDGLLFADENLNVLDLNPAAESMLGYTASELRGRRLNDVLISTQPLVAELELSLSDGKSREVGERKTHRRDGSEFLAFFRAVPISQEGKSTRLVILFTDLSEHEAFHLQNQQLQQRAAMGEITAIFAHEVRNPINSISTGLQLMQMNLPDQDPLQEQIKKLQEDVDRLEHRMKSLDAFSRNLEPYPDPFDLGEFCRTQLERWRPRLNRKHIKEHFQVAVDTPLILGDRKALDQVLTNLITNAVQAMEDQHEGILAIKIQPSSEDPAMVEMQLSDSGPGIPDEIRKKIFEPFFTTKGQEGSGLGLAIARRIVMAHKGKIECESFPGGTLFKVQLPVAPGAAAEGTPAL